MKKVLIFGDSISLGVHDCENGGWANHFQESHSEVEVFNESVSGFTVVELWGRLPLVIEKIMELCCTPKSFKFVQAK